MRISTYSLDEAFHNTSIGDIGGKAWRLSNALSHGLRVPPGVVIPHRFMDLQDSRDVKKMLRNQLKSLNEEKLYAVRSSSTFEDHPAASGAGIFKSILSVQGTEAIVDAVFSCWEERSSPLVIRYAERIGISQIILNVFVQEMIIPNRSGVAVINRPKTELFIAEGVRGVGASVVSGEVSPDFVSAVLLEGTIVKTRQRDQSFDSIFDSNFVKELSTFLCRVMEVFGQDQEVEWAEDMSGMVWLLQTRPLTSKSVFKAQ